MSSSPELSAVATRVEALEGQLFKLKVFGVAAALIVVAFGVSGFARLPSVAKEALEAAGVSRVVKELDDAKSAALKSEGEIDRLLHRLRASIPGDFRRFKQVTALDDGVASKWADEPKMWIVKGEHSYVGATNSEGFQVVFGFRLPDDLKEARDGTSKGLWAHCLMGKPEDSGIAAQSGKRICVLQHLARFSDDGTKLSLYVPKTNATSDEGILFQRWDVR